MKADRCLYIAFYLVLQRCLGYIIASDCDALNHRTHIVLAIDDFKKMAKCTVGRAYSPDLKYRKGNLLQTILGAPSEDDIATRDYVRSKCIVAPLDGQRRC